MQYNRYSITGTRFKQFSYTPSYVTATAVVMASASASDHRSLNSSENITECAMPSGGYLKHKNNIYYSCSISSVNTAIVKFIMVLLTNRNYKVRNRTCSHGTDNLDNILPF